MKRYRPTMRRSLVVALVGVMGLAAVACGRSASVTLEGVPESMSPGALEMYFRRPIYEPTGPAELDRSGLVDLGTSGEAPFGGKVAGISYRWNEYRLIVLQGPPSVEWTLENDIHRPDAEGPFDYRGGKLVILPASGTGGDPTARSGAAAYWQLDDWMIRVEAAPASGTQNEHITVGSMRQFLDLLAI